MSLFQGMVNIREQENKCFGIYRGILTANINEMVTLNSHITFSDFYLSSLSVHISFSSAFLSFTDFSHTNNIKIPSSYFKHTTRNTSVISEGMENEMATSLFQFLMFKRTANVNNYAFNCGHMFQIMGYINNKQSQY